MLIVLYIHGKAKEWPDMRQRKNISQDKGQKMSTDGGGSNVTGEVFDLTKDIDNEKPVVNIDNIDNEKLVKRRKDEIINEHGNSETEEAAFRKGENKAFQQREKKEEHASSSNSPRTAPGT